MVCVAEVRKFVRATPVACASRKQKAQKPKKGKGDDETAIMKEAGGMCFMPVYELAAVDTIPNDIRVQLATRFTSSDSAFPSKSNAVSGVEGWKKTILCEVVADNIGD